MKLYRYSTKSEHETLNHIGAMAGCNEKHIVAKDISEAIAGINEVLRKDLEIHSIWLVDDSLEFASRG